MSGTLPPLPHKSYGLKDFNMVSQRLRSQARAVAIPLGVIIRPKRTAGALKFSGWTMSYRGVSSEIKTGDNLAELKKSLVAAVNGIST